MDMITKRRIIVPLIAIFAFALGTMLSPHSTRMITYRLSNETMAFKKNEPLAGLGGLQDTAILRMLRSGDTNQAIRNVEAALDFAIENSRSRRPLLEENGKTELDRVLRRVAEYRKEFPRKIPKLSPENERVAYFRQLADQSAKYYEEIDAFLKQFGLTNDLAHE